MSSASQQRVTPTIGVFADSRFRRVSGHYQTETLRPIICLAYVLPFLLTYELGVIFLDNQSIRSGLDVWLNSALQFIGFGELLLLPLITTFGLFGLHHLRSDRWSFRPTVLAGMLLESIALALIVLCAAKAQHLFLLQYSDPGLKLTLEIASQPGPASEAAFCSAFVSFCGAGLYEELVFRLLMVPALISVLMRTGMKKFPAVMIAVLVSSLIFAAAHYNLINPAGGVFQLPGFMARAIAGLFFCLVFLFRGFGVAVGTHVAYDVLILM